MHSDNVTKTTDILYLKNNITYIYTYTYIFFPRSYYVNNESTSKNVDDFWNKTLFASVYKNRAYA